MCSKYILRVYGTILRRPRWSWMCFSILYNSLFPLTICGGGYYPLDLPVLIPCLMKIMFSVAELGYSGLAIVICNSIVRRWLSHIPRWSWPWNSKQTYFTDNYNYVVTVMHHRPKIGEHRRHQQLSLASPYRMLYVVASPAWHVYYRSLPRLRPFDESAAIAVLLFADIGDYFCRPCVRVETYA